MLLRATIGASAFASEKLNDPVDPALCEWDSSLFDWPGLLFDEWPERLTVKTIAWDPSKGRDSKLGDYSAIVLFGRDKETREYMECDAARGRSVEVMCDILVAHVARFRPDAVAIESNTFQELCAIPLKLAAQRAGVDLPPLHLVDNHVNKQVRIRRLGAPLSQKRIRFKARSPGTALLIQQLRDFGPPGTHDDTCFPAGTLIETENGPQPIESIQHGARVLTRFGYRSVLLAGCTGSRQTIILETKDGRILQGTPNHPVFSGMTFAPMRLVDTMWSCHEHAPRSNLKQSSGMGSSSVAIRMRSSGLIEHTLPLTLAIGRPEYSLSIKRYGRTHTVRSQREWWSTTRTETRSTTTLAIWNALPRPNIVGFIVKDGADKGKPQSGLRTWGAFAPWHRNGTHPQMALHGTVNTAKRHGRPVSLPSFDASTAAASTKLLRQSTASIARHGVGNGFTLPTVAMRAVSVFAKRPGPTVPVYNLTVDGGEYFAGGFLVHNCDAAEMARRLAVEITNDRVAPRRQIYNRVTT